MWFTLANTQNILPSGDEMAMGADIFGSSCLMRCQQGFEWIQLKGRRMISAKKLADDMADAIHLDSNLFRGFAHGFVNLPVDFYYLGRDFIDTDSRTINSYDKERMIRMVKHGMASRQSLEKVIRLFLDNFIKHVDLQKVKELSAKGGGNFLGRMAFNQLVSGNMGYILSSKLIPRLVTGLTIGSILSVGAAMSRSVYVARDLQCRNPAAYNMLRRLGDLDLLYFIVADKTRPFEDAVALWSTDRNKFHQTCCYFFEKVNL
ncbi:hypothetical protein [Gibbsiella quercinecans]|uniref:hypothetical protein n=1 Tax=Gibbsiella quercinecans TaxID=929813 RepID=UPI001E4C99D5|nr:hypothetical protein [Gibbsiella quercinecans]